MPKTKIKLQGLPKSPNTIAPLHYVGEAIVGSIYPRYCDYGNKLYAYHGITPDGYELYLEVSDKALAKLV